MKEPTMLILATSEESVAARAGGHNDGR